MKIALFGFFAFLPLTSYALECNPWYQTCCFVENVPTQCRDSHETGPVFVATGKARFSPWTTDDYCESARYITDSNAQQKCAPAKARRISQYDEFPGGDAICRVKAQYICK